MPTRRTVSTQLMAIVETAPVAAPSTGLTSAPDWGAGDSDTRHTGPGYTGSLACAAGGASRPPGGGSRVRRRRCGSGRWWHAPVAHPS